MAKRIHTISFHHAFEGLVHAVKTQPNFVVHLVLSSIAITVGFLLHLTNIEWTIILFTISLGLVIELINTSIESTVDLITSQYHQLAKVAKDTSAAAMLIYAVGAVIVAVFIFLPKLWPFI